MTNGMQGIWDKSKESKKEPEAVLRIGLAVAALVLGVVSVAMSIIVTGLLFGLMGVILGIVCLRGVNKGKKMAGWGVGLSVVGTLLSCFFGLIYCGIIAQRNASFEGYGDVEKVGEESSMADWMGKEAPDFKVADMKGNTITLSQFKGRRVVLNCWESYSLESRDAIDNLIELRSAVEEDDLVIIGIGRGEEKKLVDLQRRLQINYPVVKMEGIPEPFDGMNVYSTPITFFIDRNGIIQSFLDEYHDLKTLKSLAMADDYKADTNEQTQTEKTGNGADTRATSN